MLGRWPAGERIICPPMPLTPEILAQLKSCEVAATPGDWSEILHLPGPDWPEPSPAYCGPEPCPVAYFYGANRVNDARLIALVRNWLPDLLAELEKKDVEIQRLIDLLTVEQRQ